MANIIKLYPNGVTCGKSGYNKAPVVRTSTTGWSAGTSRRLVQWLYSVHRPSLIEYGFSFTLTVKDCPPTPKAWNALRRAFNRRLERRGLVRLQWLTEWQRRGVPHLHGCAYFPEPHQMRLIMEQWLAVASEFGASPLGQDSKPLTYGEDGWVIYMAKHSARGVSHYQRDSKNMPTAWHKSGRMWGYVGSWDIREPITVTLDERSHYRFRKLVKQWRISKARENIIPECDPIHEYFKDPKRLARHIQALRALTRARKLLKSNNFKLSQVRGVHEFIPLELTILFVLSAKSHSDGVVEDRVSNAEQKIIDRLEIERRPTNDVRGSAKAYGVRS